MASNKKILTINYKTEIPGFNKVWFDKNTIINNLISWNRNK